jgi:hypothetical protein
MGGSNVIAHLGHIYVFAEHPGGDDSFLSVIVSYLLGTGLQSFCRFIEIIDWTALQGTTRLQFYIRWLLAPFCKQSPLKITEVMYEEI